MTMTFELVEHHKSGGGNYILRIKHTMGWPWLIAWLFRLEKDVWHQSYIGSCTVWHEYPSFKRQPTHVEARLSEIWTKIRHEESL